MGYYKALKQFTRATRAGMVVGNPDHRDPRGRFLSIDNGVGSDLAAEGLVAPVSRSEYHEGIEGREVDGGEVLVAQVSGKRPPVSARWTDAALAKEAKVRGVDISGAKTRGEKIKLINAKETSSAANKVEGTNSAFSRTGRETAESTRHSRRASPQNDVNDSGTVDTELAGSGGNTQAPADLDIAPEEKAPTNGEGSSSSGSSDQSSSSSSSGSAGSASEGAANVSGSGTGAPPPEQ